MLNQSATHSPTRTVRNYDSGEIRFTGGSDGTASSQRWRPEIVSRPARTLTPWLTLGWVIVWLSLLIVVAVAIGRMLPNAAEAIVSPAGTREQAQSFDGVGAEGVCAALNMQVKRMMTVDELRDLRDQLCPTLSELQLMED